MNIIELVRKIITEYPKISEFSHGVHIDYTDSEPTNYGLSSTGDGIVSEDVLGDEVRRHNFILYAINQAFNDFERLANSGFLLELSYWLGKQGKGQEIEVVIGDSALDGKLEKLSCENGMLYEIPDGNIGDGVRYQLQIYAEYKVESEDI